MGGPKKAPPQERRSAPEDPGPAQRQRAPTITIDTSSPSTSPQPEFSPTTSPTSGHRPRPSSSEARPLLSVGSRPASPYNTFLSTSRNDKSPDSRSLDARNLLNIPGRCSRTNSLDQHSLSSYGGETLLTTPTSVDGDSSYRDSIEAVPFHSLETDRLLEPDPGEENEFHVDSNPFAFSPGQLLELVNPKSLSTFHALGGLQQLIPGLRTDRLSGLSLDETTFDGHVVSTEQSGFLRHGIPSFHHPTHHTSSPRIRPPDPELYADRKRVFGSNRLPEKKSNSLLHIMWMTFNDKVLIILTIVASISLALGLYQDFGQAARFGGPKVRWVEGVTIMVAVIIVKDDRLVKAIRSGKSLQISVYDIYVGDVLHLEPGDLVPADGVFISGHSVRCDESSVTGESDQKKKTSSDEVMARLEAEVDVRKLDPFILSGSKVLEGTGTYLVTSVGVHSGFGKLIMAMTNDTEPAPTPLQAKLGAMAEQITKVGCAFALLLFLVLFAKFLFLLPSNTDSPTEKAQTFLQILIVAITVIVIAVPEGLPLAVTLALAFAMTKMLKDNNLVRVLSSCETMGNATAICSDKTGTLTTNKMTVVMGTLGTTFHFGVDGKTIHSAQINGDEAISSNAMAVSLNRLASLLSKEAKDILVQAIATNTTAFEGEEDGQRTYIGSKTETALLSFAKTYLGMGQASEERANSIIVQMVPFDSSRKCMASVVKLSDGSYRMYVKGASEILLSKSTCITRDPTGSVKGVGMVNDERNALAETMDKYTRRSMRTISIVYRDFSSWPPEMARTREDDPNEAVFEDVFKEMVFLGILGIQDPLRPGVKKAVERCQHAGVTVRMVTGDNIGTATAIAKECGIYTPGGVAMEGPEFRKLSGLQMDRIIPQLQILARSSPQDKMVLVKKLKELGEIVAVTGDGTNDGPALRAADVGFSMGISGTEIAKEASSIILMDDDFSSIIKALEWGRAVNDAVRRFLQFQLTVNITAVAATFVSAISDPNEEPILTPVQLLWVNLIMDTFAALALATDPPTPSILNRKPDAKSSPLITLNMWKMIIGQSVYQLLITLTLNFAGNEILGYKTEFEQSRLETLVFNTYVWMQIFNQLNNRRLDNKFNIFEGLSRNWFFICISAITIIGQVFIVSVGSSALSTIRLDYTQWAISIALGAISLPVAVIIRLIPDEFIRSCIPNALKTKQPQPAGDSGGHQFEWSDALNNIREHLVSFKRIRGRGRLDAFRFMLQDPREPLLESHRDSSETPINSADIDGGSSWTWKCPEPTPPLGTAAAMAGVVAGSIAGWPPNKHRAGPGATAVWEAATYIDVGILLDLNVDTV
ncbi:hypothetical protein G7Y89_g11401 [Cudoniella acicularis]|uniref:Calcium-transporting ATPase n=1 Tax=Cudoniella acicularis TaxID=354080 RepID=A0A8H4RDB1_9HELO|nr:hypothetical protein G7Y89_g11401 [Cudoniella acicularis]